MNQAQFEQQYQRDWARFAELLAVIEAKKLTASGPQLQEFAPLYRKVCHYHALARTRNYSSDLVACLEALVLRGHHTLYHRRTAVMANALAFVTVGFPRLLRREQQYFWWASALLYAPALLVCLMVVLVPEAVYMVLTPTQVEDFEQMYRPANRIIGSAREAQTNWSMFGYYINNNIAVAFRTFATGIVCGLGTVVFLVFNGVLLGAVAGHLLNIAYSDTFFSFVIAHGSFELTAIAIAGAAGLRLGMALLFPGHHTRLEALKQAAQVAIRLMYGVIMMLVIAAFLEAFWSANNALALWQKYLVGGLLWALVMGYLTMSGRRFASR